MMKQNRWIYIFIFVLIALYAVKVSAQGQDFVIDANGVLTEYNGSSSAVTIPSNVKAIGIQAFQSNHNITSVNIPSSVKSIGHWAFADCENLTKVTLHEGLKEIGMRAFMYCYNLKTINLPHSLTGIYASAFYNCWLLSKADLYENLEFIGANAFYGTSIRRITVPMNVIELYDEAIPQGAVITAYKGSEAERWAKENGYSLVLLDAPANQVLPAKITLDKTSISMIEDDYELITAVISPANTTNKAVVWSSSNTNVVTLEYGQIHSEAEGTAVITARSLADPSLKATCKVTVDNDYKIKAFVRRSYQLILGRNAEEGGLLYWTDLLKSGKNTAAKMIEGFIYSKEFLNKKYSNEKVAEILYRTMMDRTADASGKAYWKKFLDDGLSYRYVIRGFAGSKEFQNICEDYGIKPGTLTLTENRDKNVKVTQFVSRNYRIALGRSGDADGLNFWTGKILNKSLTPQQVADSFVFSKECVNRKLNNLDFVTMLYSLYMDRTPEQGGLNYWVQKLNSGMSRQTVAKSFGSSQEFKNIVKSYNL